MCVFLVDEGRDGPNTIISGPSSARQAFRWRADDGPTLNAGLVAVLFMGPILLFCQETLYFGDFSRGRGSLPPLDPPMV